MNSMLLSILVIFGCVINGLNAQGQCRGQAQCKSIYDCQPLLALAERRRPEDVDTLRRAHCGHVGNIPAVCCPEQPRPPPPPPPPPPPRTPPPPTNNICTTPDSRPGNCINLYSCQNLLDLLQQPISQQNAEFVQRSRCIGPSQYSVCCPSSQSGREKPLNKCQASISALPPDPDSGCCGVDSTVASKIFGGSEVAIDQYPWLVLIEYAMNGQTKIKTSCGGSLISGRYVLTAAHCVTGAILQKSGKPVMVRVGEYDKDNEGADCTPAEAGGVDCTDGAIRIPIERTIPHPEYNTRNGPRWHDIALIRMSRNAPYTDFVRPICLPRNDITRFADSSYNLTTAGWGAVSERENSNRVKLYVDLPFVSQTNCQPAYNNINHSNKREPLWKGQICAGGVKGKDSCRGDSGGPLMYENNRKYEAVGIVSFGHRECGLESVPAVYTHVYEYDSWIRSNLSP